MTSRSQTRPKTSLAIAIGSLLVPLSAVAAVLIPNVGADAGTGSSQTAPAFAGSSTTATNSTSSDLESACGSAGLALVELETAGTIDSFQQAALEALRPICTEAGMALPPPKETAPAPVVVTAAQGTVPTVSGQTGGPDREREDDDEWDEEDHGGEDRQRDDQDEDDRHGEDDGHDDDRDDH